MKNTNGYLRSEVISIGDELTSGQRLDTNSQWLSQQLGDIGLQTIVHSTVADDLQELKSAISLASRRSDIVVVTGGLGPTADDLTRQVIADVAGVDLIDDPASAKHIRHMFESRGREMPEINLVQARFPAGSNIIPNQTGTAPGIDFHFHSDDQNCRLFAFPGVPAELKPMWHDYVKPTILNHLPDLGLIVHHSIHCFGLAESEVETLLPEIVKRGRVPVVGITATKATITLRISANGQDLAECQKLIEPTAALIHEKLGDNVFGENGIELQDVVIEKLVESKRKFAVVDLAACGLIADLLQSADPRGVAYRGTISPAGFNRDSANEKVAAEVRTRWIEIARETFDCDLVLVIGPAFQHTDILKRDVHLCDGSQSISHRFNAKSNPSITVLRTIKQAMNFMRLALQRGKI